METIEKDNKFETIIANYCKVMNEINSGLIKARNEAVNKNDTDWLSKQIDVSVIELKKKGWINNINS